MTYESLFAETVYLRGHQGDPIDAYLARPLGAGPYPGVVVIHHMPGWDGAHKEIGRRFAHHGYVDESCPTCSFARARRRRKRTVRASAQPAACLTIGRWATCRRRSITSARAALSERQGRRHRILLRRAPGVPRGMHAARHRCRDRLLRRRCRGQARGADAAAAGRARRFHAGPAVPAARIFRHRGHAAVTRRRGQNRGSARSNSAKPTSSIRTRTPAMRSLPSIGRNIACTRRSTDGRKCLPGSASICAEICAEPAHSGRLMAEMQVLPICALCAVVHRRAVGISLRSSVERTVIFVVQRGEFQ